MKIQDAQVNMIIEVQPVPCGQWFRARIIEVMTARVRFQYQYGETFSGTPATIAPKYIRPVVG